MKRGCIKRTLFEIGALPYRLHPLPTFKAPSHSQTKQKTADMSTVGDPRGASAIDQKRNQVVEDQIETEHPSGRQIKGIHQQGKEKNEGFDPIAGKPEEITAEHTGGR